MNHNIRVVVAENHRLFREGLRLILNDEKNLEIVGEAANGQQAVDIISDLKPDVALLDINMPEVDGIQIIPIIRQKSLGTKPLMLTGATDEATIIKALMAGARGYLSKNTSIAGLIKAIKVVHNDEMWIERKLIPKFFNADIKADLDRKDRPKKTEVCFTPREQDILSLLIKGLTNKEIAKDLSICEKTVKSHLNRIFKKLKVSRRLQAILCVLKLGSSYESS